jgi:hypothetical protein
MEWPSGVVGVRLSGSSLQPHIAQTTALLQGIRRFLLIAHRRTGHHTKSVPWRTEPRREWGWPPKPG